MARIEKNMPVGAGQPGPDNGQPGPEAGPGSPLAGLTPQEQQIVKESLLNKLFPTPETQEELKKLTPDDVNKGLDSWLSQQTPEWINEFKDSSLEADRKRREAEAQAAGGGGGRQQPPRLGGTGEGNGRDNGNPPEDPKNNERSNFLETEKRPSFDEVVTRIRKLEAMPTEERYDPGLDGSYPKLTEMELMYKHFYKYYEEMESVEMAELTLDLKEYSQLELDLKNGKDTVFKEALELFDRSGNEDPRLRGLKKQVEIFEGIKNRTTGQEIALQVARERSVNGTQLDGEQGAKAKLNYKIKKLEKDLAGLSRQNAEQRITELKRKAGLTPAEAAELSVNQDNLARFTELETERRRLQDYENYNTPNILVERIRSLKNDPTRKAELRQVLVEFLGEEKDRLNTEISLTKAIEYEALIQRELRQIGQVEMEDWEIDEEAEDRKNFEEAEQRELIPFEQLPPFSVLSEALHLIDEGDFHQFDSLVKSNVPLMRIFQMPGLESEEGMVTALENQVARYLFRAYRLGITKNVHNAFNELYSQHKIPEIGYYGEVHRVDERYIHNLLSAFQNADRGERFRLKGWPPRFRGVINFVLNRAAHRMDNVIAPSDVDEAKLTQDERALLVESDLRILSGEWNPERADKKAESLIGKRLYWEKSVTGYYQFKIDPDVSKNPYAAKQLGMAVDQWIAYMASGVISPNPQERFKEWQQFIGQLAPLAEKIFRLTYPEDTATLLVHPENAGRATSEIKALRQQAKFRALAPVAAYANATDEAEAFSSVLQNLSEDIEGPDVYREGYVALDGMVALALDALENDPEWSKVYFQLQGSLGHLSTEEGAKQLLEKTLLKQLAKELALYSLSDKPVGAKATIENTDKLIANSIDEEIAQIKDQIEASKDHLEQKKILEERLTRWEDRQKKFGSVSQSHVFNVEMTELSAGIARLREDVNATGITPERKKELKRQISEQEKQLVQIKQERTRLSEITRKENLKRISRDQPREDFRALYGKLEDQEDFKVLSDPEKKLRIKQKELDAKEAISSAIVILNINGQQSARSGPTVKIINPELLSLQYKIEKLNELIDDNIDQIKVLDIPADQRTEEQRKLAEKVAKMRQASEYYPELEKTQAGYAELEKKFGISDRVLDKRAERVPVRTIVRVAQYVSYRAEKMWTEEADRIMKSSRNKQEKEKAIQELCLAIIPDAWNVKKNLPNDKDRKLNLNDVLEGVYRDALDRVMGRWGIERDGFFVNEVPAQGFRATFDVPVVVEEGGKRVIKKQLLVDDDTGKPLYVEDVDRKPESNGMLMAYFGTEEIMTHVISSPHKVAEAKAGGGGLLGRSLRILDPAFNRLVFPEYQRDFQKLQRAIHAGVEAQWQRHFQIKIEVLERTVIGADIRKNKTGKKADRYKIIDGNISNNLLEFGREKLYTTGRIINHAAEIIAHKDRRSRRAPDLGLYSPMQHESAYDESAVEDTREFMGLIDTGSPIQASREGSRVDFLYLKLKGARWGIGYKQRVALESGPVDGGKQHTGLLEKIWANGDRINKFWDGWKRHHKGLEIKKDSQDSAEIELRLNSMYPDVEFEDYISTAEGADERLKISMESLYPDLSYYRLAQAPLWKDGVDPFLPDGALNFERRELGEANTLKGSDNGTSRHTVGIWFEREKQWKMDPRKGARWYPGLAEISRDLDKKRWILGAAQSASDVLKGRLVR